MATTISTTNGPFKTLLVWPNFIEKSTPIPITVFFTILLKMNQYVCKNITTTDHFFLIIPRTDLEGLLQDPVYRFPQVKVIYVYYKNHHSYQHDQVYFQNRYPKLRFCHERDLPKEFGRSMIDIAIHTSRPIDRTAISSFASSVVERISAKLPTTANRHPEAQILPTFTPCRGFSVKNIELIDARFVCPACQLIFREPYQLSCGHHICHPCIVVENE